MSRYIPLSLATSICEQAAARHGVTVEAMLNDRTRGARHAARRDAMQAMRDLGASYSMIGKRMQRHHTTVMHTLGTLAS